MGEIANLDLLRAWVKRGSARSSTLSSRTRSRLTTGRCFSSSSNILGRKILSAHVMYLLLEKNHFPKSRENFAIALSSRKNLCSWIYILYEFYEKNEFSCKVECTELCPCRTLQQRARADRSLPFHFSCLIRWISEQVYKIIMTRYIFSLASNPFYLWLICTIFYEAGEGYVPTTLTQVHKQKK